VQLQQLGVYSVFVSFWAFPMQVATIAPQILRVLLAVGPDMAKVLAVVALRNPSLSSI
jgi:hypothetical protein